MYDMTWYVLALVTILTTNEPDIKMNTSIKFPSKEACDLFISTHNYNIQYQLHILFPNIKVRNIMCIDHQSAKELQQELYGNKK